MLQLFGMYVFGTLLVHVLVDMILDERRHLIHVGPLRGTVVLLFLGGSEADEVVLVQDSVGKWRWGR